MTETITCTVINAATLYTTTLPSGGMGVYEARFTFGELLIAFALFLLSFSILTIYVAERRRQGE